MNYTQIEMQFNASVNKKVHMFVQANPKLDPNKLNEEIFKNVVLPELYAMRRQALIDLSKVTDRNVIYYYSSFLNQNKGNNDFQITDNDMNGLMNAIYGLDPKKGLDLVLHTPGGSITATECIVSYLRTKFDGNIRTIVPHLAMSAGTMICCASKEILMGNHSSLGPIDPQFRGVSAEGVIEEFEQAINESIQTPNKSLIWKEIIAQYRPTFYGDCQKAVLLSKELVTDWLNTGMFKKSKNKKAKTSKVIEHITSHATTKVHDRHFDYKKCKEIGLNVSLLEDDQKLQDAVLTLHHTFVLTSNVNSNLIKAIENNNGQTLITHGIR